MSSCPDSTFELIGVSHHTLPVELREEVGRAVLERSALFSSCLADSVASGIAVISTCNRVEIVGVVPARALEIGREAPLYNAVRSLFSAVPKEALYHHQGLDAVRHLFRVAASLDSLVVGEAQILGQVKMAYVEACEAGTADKFLHALFQSALRVAKRVRDGTSIGERGVSVSYVGAQLARQIVGDLGNSRVLILGGGRMAELVAIHLASYGCRHLTVANRTVSRAAELASRIGGVASGLDGVSTLAEEADIIIGALGVSSPIITAKDVRRWRRRTPIFMIDLGVPRNFDAAVSSFDQVYLYDIDDLGEIAAQNRQEREVAAQEAEVLVEYGVHQFERWLKRLAAEPLVVELRSLVQTICERESSLLAGEISPKVRDLFTHRVSQKLAHHITAFARRQQDAEESPQEAHSPIAELFESLVQNS